MPNSVTKRRSRVVLLAVIAVLASLFALPAAPALGASVGDVEFPADWSACVGDATASAGFTDTAGSFAAAAIDCIAYYKVTQGTGTGVYSPGSGVTREQMALFLVRAAGPANISLPAAADQGLTDISGLPQASQDAINQLVAMGISKGTGTGTYGPAQVVSRYEMALFLIRFLDYANDGKIDNDLSASTVGSGFTDTASVSFEAYGAIETAYDHGITTGTTKTTFSPFAAVSREQMAAFIGRTLAHTNAAPAGVTIVADPTSGDAGGPYDWRITVRDADFDPVPFALVDTFYVDDKAKSPLASDGTCDADAINLFGGDTCEIDLGDVEVDANGNDTGSGTLPLADKSQVIWAWTGEVGDTFDADTTDVSSVTLEGKKPVILGWDVDTDWNGDDYFHFGETVTWTFQLVDTNNSDAHVAKAGVDIVIQWDRAIYIDDSIDSELFNQKSTVTTDANGTATFSLSAADPDSNDTGDTGDDYVEYYFDSITPEEGGAVTAPDDAIWTDEAPQISEFEVATSAEYADNTDSAASVTVTATIHDQYGDGVSGEPIRIYEDNGVTTVSETSTLTTGANGSRSFSFKADETGGLVAEFYACWDNDSTAPFECDDDTSSVEFYFAVEGGSSGSGLVWVFDAEHDLAVIDFAGVPTWASWDSGDQFHEDGDPVTQATFEKNAKNYTSLSWGNYGSTTAPAEFNVFTPAP